MFEVEAAEGQVLIKEGDDGDNFYILCSGKYEVYIDRRPGDCVHAYRNPGESFGELALMYNCPRAATIKCAKAGTLIALDRATFRSVRCAVPTLAPMAPPPPGAPAFAGFPPPSGAITASSMHHHCTIAALY